MLLKPECIYFPGDRPCNFHKKKGIKCNNCNHFRPIAFKILIIKLDALGDVLRTTSILPTLKSQYPKSHITWITKTNAQSVLINNFFIDEILKVEDTTTLTKLLVEKFDILFHPDASAKSASIASVARANIKKGFGLSKKGKVIPFDESAVEWFEMGAFDDKKKSNKKTYQQIIHEICDLNYNRDIAKIILSLSDKEKNFKNNFYYNKKLDNYDFILGLNTGAGNRWKFKKWTIEGYKKLIEKVIKKFNCAILLYGGKIERKRNEMLSDISSQVINTGSNNSIRQFFSLISLSDILITGDTLALHAATALEKQIICLFGPTSANEIEDYGRIIKIQPDLRCLVCYKQDCDYIPNCMESITVDMVFEALLKAINRMNK